jgi:hypothetical protein
VRLAPYPDECVQIFFRIKNKEQQLVDFVYNRPQRLQQERESGHSFTRVLKARKMGISSRRIASDLWKCSTRKHEHRVALTHTGEAADKVLAERVKPFVDNCRFPLGAVQRSWGYDFPLTGSRYYVGTAGSRKFGRGDDVTGRHFMETAHWESPEVADGLDEALVPGADGLDETTANGYNFWKEGWEAAKAGRSKDRAIFLPWSADEAYIADPSNLGSLTDEETELMRAFNLTLGQIAWRRQKMASMRDPSIFPQEYPITDSEAFLSSGRPVFDWLGLLKHEGRCVKPQWVGDVIDRGTRLEFMPKEHGYLKIWKMPEREHVYAVGSDVAKGVKEGAYSTCEVFDLGDSEQVAEWHGHMTPDLFAAEAVRLAQFYNWAWLIYEAWPGPGETAQSHSMEYPKLWKHIDSDRFGWESNAHTKPKMIYDFNAALRDVAVTSTTRRGKWSQASAVSAIVSSEPG